LNVKEYGFRYKRLDLPWSHKNKGEVLAFTQSP